MIYTTVFAITTQSDPAPTAPLVFIATLAVALGGLAVWITVKKPSSRRLARIRFFSGGIAVGLCVILIALNSLRTGYDELVEAMRSGSIVVVEGSVQNYHPMPAAGHDTERFTVGGEPFAYSDYKKTGGFNNAASHGGPIRAGLPVKITFVRSSYGNVIVKLEIART